MGCMLRSDLMTFCDIFIQPETAFEIVAHFGEMGCAQFVDEVKRNLISCSGGIFKARMTPDVKAFQRNYVTEVCRCAEMERKLLYMESEMLKDNIEIVMYDSLKPAALPLNELSALENIIDKWESDVIDMSENQTTLLKNYLELTEMNYVLNNIGPMLGESEMTEEAIFGKTAAGDTGLQGRLFVISGVVKRSRSFPFEMMMWRVSHGNIYYRLASQDTILQDPVTGQDIRKVAFLAIFQGEQLSARLEKVCSGFHVNMYTCPQSYNDRMDMMIQLGTRIGDLEQVMSKTKYYRCKALRTVSKQWDTWMVQIKKSKAVYHTMNMFTLDITRKCLIGQCWVPDTDLQKVEDMLARITEKEGSNVESFILKSDDADEPPTYHRTNKFTKGFQALINAYGDSTYRELNPGKNFLTF
ncbi:Vha100-2 isoform A [Danaus plexippus plexippus]|uniref:V-type proton ATPase subunit a n=1 Tax=Danaus plexippus plexippus TaxID=278856 RepID=A0A212F9P8_DANPL|nr:Vha100-2 isoform A [Danaus plexippus plexippus]